MTLFEKLRISARYWYAAAKRGAAKWYTSKNMGHLHDVVKVSTAGTVKAKEKKVEVAERVHNRNEAERLVPTI